MKNGLLRSFLALDRFRSFADTLRARSREESTPAVGADKVLISFLIAMLPGFAPYVTLPGDSVDLVTVFVGVAAALAIVLRRHWEIASEETSDWRSALSLTHTAFAVGCIPAVLILIASPSSFAAMGSERAAAAHGGAGPPAAFNVLIFIGIVAAWAAVTEEFIYRGLLVSALRRWRAIGGQPARDAFAILASATVFAVVHLPAWGPGMSVALFGIGLGFGAAYIAVGESVLPVIVYHAIFDALSLAVSLRR